MLHPEHQLIPNYDTFEEAERHASRIAKAHPGTMIIIAKAHAEVVVEHKVTMLFEDENLEDEHPGPPLEDLGKPPGGPPPSADENPQKAFIENRPGVSAELLKR